MIPAAPTLLSGDRPARPRSNPWARRILVFASCIVLLDALFGDRGLAQMLRARQDLRRAAASLDRLRQENAAMREQVGRLRRDPAAIEAVARRDLGLIRRGEIVILLKDLE